MSNPNKYPFDLCESVLQESSTKIGEIEYQLRNCIKNHPIWDSESVVIVNHDDRTIKDAEGDVIVRIRAGNYDCRSAYYGVESSDPPAFKSSSLLTLLECLRVINEEYKKLREVGAINDN